MDYRPIGVFDSGVGGLSIVRELRRRLPGEDIVYFADQAHCPYGSRSVDEIRALATAATRRLLLESAKLIVVACNTVSTTALDALRARFAVPFVGVVPAVKPACQQSQTGIIGVLATEATLRSPAFEALVQTFAAGTRVVRQACPDLVTAVEHSELGTPTTDARIARRLDPLRSAHADQIVLGCTHFEFIRQSIERIAGPGVQVIGAARPVAEQTARVLEQTGLSSDQPGGRLKLLTSGEPNTFIQLASRLLEGDELSSSLAPAVSFSATPIAEMPRLPRAP